MSTYELLYTDLGPDANTPKTWFGRLLQRIDRADPFNAVGTNGWVLIRDGKRIHHTQDPWTFDEAARYFLRVVGVRAAWQPHPNGESNHYIANA